MKEEKPTARIPISKLTLKQLFSGMATRSFDPEKAKGWHAIIQYRITGEGGGQYYLVVKDQKCTMHEGEAENPTLIITASYDDWMAIVEGRLEGRKAFFSGQMKVEGNMNDLFRMQSVFRTTRDIE